MSVEEQYRRVLRNSCLWLLGWPAAVWFVALLAGEMPAIVVALALFFGALNCASCAFDAGRISVERWRK